MTDKDAKVSAEGVAVKDEKENTSVATSDSNINVFAKFQKAAEAKPLVLSPEEGVNTIFSKFGEAPAKKYYDLLNTVRPVDDTDTWYPPLLSIASTKGNPDALKNAGEGKWFIHETKLGLGEDTLLFPIFAHTEHTWWSDTNKMLCKSVDSTSGKRFVGDHANMVLSCGSESCPNVPDQFQKGTDPCKWTKNIYLVDSSFTNIYVVQARYFTVKELYTPMVKATKQGGIPFVPTTDSHWFTIGSFEKGEGNKKAFYGKAISTNKVLSESDAFMLNQLKALMFEWQDMRIKDRDSADEKAEKELKSVKVDSSVDTDGSTVSSFSESPSM